MGWLWNTTEDVFANSDEAGREISIYGLSAEEVIAGYNFIRSKARRLRGIPTLYSLEAQKEVGIDEIGNGAELVCRRQANPFYFVVASLKGSRTNISDLGFFIFDNAICIDFKPGPLWGEIEIETFLLLILEIRKIAKNFSIQIQDEKNLGYIFKLEKALERLANPEDDE